MSLLDILNHRRAVRHYDADKPIDKEVVRNLLLSGKPFPHIKVKG